MRRFKQPIDILIELRMVPCSEKQPNTQMEPTRVPSSSARLICNVRRIKQRDEQHEQHHGTRDLVHDMLLARALAAV